MSTHLIYFEQARHVLADSRQFAEVGHYTVPEPLQTEACTILVGGKQKAASVFVKGGNAPHLFAYSKGYAGQQGQMERELLCRFIEQRLHNPCIAPCLVVFLWDSSFMPTVQVQQEQNLAYARLKASFVPPRPYNVLYRIEA